MSYQKQNQQADRTSPGDFFGMVYTLADTHRLTIATLLRRGYGKEALGATSFLAMILIFVMYVATGDKAMLVYLGVWFIAQIKQKVLTSRLIRNGTHIHSRDTGYPHVAMQVPFVRKISTAKGFVEPMICLIGGALLCPLSVNLGGFIMLGFLSFMVANGIEKEVLRKRLERMRDAEMEQRWLSHAYKHGIDD